MIAKTRLDKMEESYEVVLYDGYAEYPAYYLIDRIEGGVAEKEFSGKLADIVQQVRRTFKIGDEIPDQEIYEILYLLKEDGIISLKSKFEGN